MWIARTLLAGCALASAACAHLPADVCPEYRDLRCLTEPQCSMDRQRGCRVCACSPPAYVPPEQEKPAPAGQPDRPARP